MSDQDIMPRYRMTPPARGRPPGLAQRGALQPAPGIAEAKARRATLTFAARAFAAANVEVTEFAAVESPNLVDLVVKTRGLWWGCGEWTTRSY
jgi:hypothetical protein